MIAPMNTLLAPPQPFAAETERCRQAQAAWERLTIRERLRPIRALRRLLAERGEALALSVTQDLGRQAEEVLGTDIIPTADACRFLERNAPALLRPTHVWLSQRPLWLFGSHDTVYRRPHGVVGIIGTWNYPVFLSGVQIVQALTAGNGVLWKPSELTPTCAVALHELFLEAGFPPDLFVRLPATREAGPQLAEAAVDYVVFTGSADVGRKLARRLGERLIPSTLELSGVDTMLVLSDANVPLAARAAWFGTTLNQGQTCLAVRRAFVHRSRYDEFVERLRAQAGAPRFEPLALWPQAEQAERLVRSAIEDGAHLLVDGAVPEACDDPPRYPPTVVVDARPEMAICREASFAPVLAVLAFDNIDEALRAQKQCAFGLGASIFAGDTERAEAIAAHLDVGTVTINDVIAPTGHPVTPFGGRGASGWGVTQGPDGLLAMTVPQAVSVRGWSYRPHYDSAGGTDAATADMLKGLLQWSHGRGWRRRWRALWQLIRGVRGTLKKEKR